MFNEQNRWWLLVAGNVLAWCVLGFYQGSHAAPQNGQPPFANAVEQRAESIQELKAINALLAEQLALLKSGKLKVVVDKP